MNPIMSTMPLIYNLQLKISPKDLPKDNIIQQYPKTAAIIITASIITLKLLLNNYKKPVIAS